jgi:hypothetical protein
MAKRTKKSKKSNKYAYLWAISLCLSFLLVPAIQKISAQPVFPPPAPIANNANFGANIQRTMGLLASSTPTNRKPVRILFYGQSITEQQWSQDVANDIKKR